MKKICKQAPQLWRNSCCSYNKILFFVPESTDPCSHRNLRRDVLSFSSNRDRCLIVFILMYTRTGKKKPKEGSLRLGSVCMPFMSSFKIIDRIDLALSENSNFESLNLQKFNSKTNYLHHLAQQVNIYIQYH